TALKASFAEPAKTPREQVEAHKAALDAYKAALEKDPGNAVIHQLRGDVFAKLGEKTWAIDAWTEAARRAPSWAMPRARVAAALATEGRYPEAVRWAEDAYRRDRTDLAPVITWAQAAYGLLE